MQFKQFTKEYLIKKLEQKGFSVKNDSENEEIFYAFEKISGINVVMEVTSPKFNYSVDVKMTSGIGVKNNTPNNDSMINFKNKEHYHHNFLLGETKHDIENSFNSFVNNLRFKLEYNLIGRYNQLKILKSSKPLNFLEANGFTLVDSSFMRKNGYSERYDVPTANVICHYKKGNKNISVNFSSEKPNIIFIQGLIKQKNDDKIVKNFIYEVGKDNKLIKNAVNKDLFEKGKWFDFVKLQKFDNEKTEHKQKIKLEEKNKFVNSTELSEKIRKYLTKKFDEEFSFKNIEICELTDNIKIKYISKETGFENNGIMNIKSHNIQEDESSGYEDILYNYENIIKEIKNFKTINSAVFNGDLCPDNNQTNHHISFDENSTKIKMDFYYKGEKVNTSEILEIFCRKGELISINMQSEEYKTLQSNIRAADISEMLDFHMQ